jgi:hypothetical protein
MNVLDIADSIDGYITACNNSFSNSEARKNYKYELSNISKDAEKYLIGVIDTIPLLKGCEIVILDSTADSGFPHTRAPKYICLPVSMCEEASKNPATFKTTLIHEGIHLHQRRNKELWDIYLRNNNWIPVLEDVIPEKYFDSIRLNPDTIGVKFYAFNGRYIPLPMFPPGRNTFSNVEIKWFDIKAGVLFHEVPKEFVNKYGNNIKQPEHPYEIYAELFSEAGLKSNDSIFYELSNI